MFIRGYLRASTQQQDADRARSTLEKLASEHGLKVASWHTENESGRKLERPVLVDLLDQANEGDVLLVESIDRLTRLTADKWDELKGMIKAKKINLVVCDIPTSHTALKAEAMDDMTKGILSAVNQMLIDILATMACKDYELRRERSAQGTAKAKALDKFKGRPVNTELHTKIAKYLGKGLSYTEIQEATGASRTTISKVKKDLRLKAD